MSVQDTWFRPVSWKSVALEREPKLIYHSEGREGPRVTDGEKNEESQKLCSV